MKIINEFTEEWKLGGVLDYLKDDPVFIP